MEINQLVIPPFFFQTRENLKELFKTPFFNSQIRGNLTFRNLFKTLEHF